MAKKKVKDLAAELLEGFLEEHGYELYNIKFVKEGGDWNLQVFIDKAGIPDDEYISTDDCEIVSRYLSERLDEEDAIEQNYYLVVSSPGMDRELFLPEHYTKFIDKEVEMTLYKPLEGAKEWTGVLGGMEDEEVLLRTEKAQVLRIPFNQIAKCRLAVVF